MFRRFSNIELEKLSQITQKIDNYAAMITLFFSPNKEEDFVK